MYDSLGKKLVIGIDASARCSGIVILYPSGHCEKLLLNTVKIPPSRRLSHIYNEFSAELIKYAPALAVMEGPSYRSTNKPFTLGEVYGVFKLALAIERVPYAIVAPRSLKKYATGSGKADKSAMLTHAASLGFSTQSDDLADAWFAAKLAQDLLGGKASIKTRAAEEVVAGMLGELPKKHRKGIKMPREVL